MKNLSIKIFGRVQGVFFRAETKKKAEELGLAGFTKNERDGTLLIEAEGEERLLRDFLDWCKKGPVGAHITYMEVYEGPPGGFKGFEVRG